MSHLCQRPLVHHLTLAYSLDRDSFSSTVYDPNGYDDVPEYKWDKNFNATMFAQSIDGYNNSIFENLKHSICEELGIEFQRTGCKSAKVIFVILANPT